MTSPEWTVRQQLIFEYWRAGKQAEAKELVLRSVRDYPDCIEATLALAQQQLLEWDRGERIPKEDIARTLEAASRQEGHDSGANLVRQALLRYRLGDRAGTKYAVTRLVDRVDNLPTEAFGQLAWLLGTSHLEEAQYEKAEGEFRVALSTDSTVSAYRRGLAHSLLGQGKTAEARFILQAWLRERPDPDLQAVLDAAQRGDLPPVRRGIL